MKWFVAAFAAVALIAPTKALACDEEHKTKQATIQNMSVKELATLKQQNKATVYDANNTDTRQKSGVIPGAKLLTSAVKYEPAKELPANKSDKIVFYCYNEQCGASHQA
ncbi:MAG TPA: rhodanese-like domain-containing protein, partial [Myxococcales bacterium]|nr:rhodanese-like domain-containing protein [Myxococcales bacterium]